MIRWALSVFVDCCALAMIVVLFPRPYSFLIAYIVMGLTMTLVFYPVIAKYVFDYTGSASHRRLIITIGVLSLMLGWPVYLFNALRRGISRHLGR